MARGRTRTKHRNGKHGITIPLTVVAGFVPLAGGVWARRGNMIWARDFAVASLTGLFPTSSGYTWQPSYLVNGLLPILGGMGVHMLANKLGINRLLARNHIPLIRV